MVYGYIRVSTDKQTAQNQKLAIEQWAIPKMMVIDEWVDETISGAINPENRKLGFLLKQLQEGDLLIVTELSRLGRSLIMIFNIMQELLDKKVHVIAIKENFELQDDIQSKVLTFAFGLSAEIERKLIIERTNAGLARARAKGVHLGRKKGVKNKVHKLSAHRAKIERYYKAGMSIRALAIHFHVRWRTMRNWLRDEGLLKEDDKKKLN